MRTGAPMRVLDCICLLLCEFVIVLALDILLASIKFYPVAYISDNFRAILQQF
jgi:hypothetical protein